MIAAIVSHSYLEPENRKNVLALAQYATVRVILPQTGPVLVFSDYDFKQSDLGAGYFLPFRPIYISHAQYLLSTFTMGLRRLRPDVINVDYNPWSAVFLQVLFCRALFCPRAKLVCMIKKNTHRRYAGWRGRLKDWWVRFTVKHVDHFMVASSMAGELCQRELSVSSHRITVVHHLGVDTSLFAPGPARSADAARTDTVVGYCGRFEIDKGVADLIDAAQLARGQMARPLVLRLLGSGSLTAELEEEATRHDWLEILPPVANAEVSRFLQTLDIFVIPSRILADHQEHDAHALLEALAVGVASIGTRSGIIPEILGDGTGLLVRPEAPRELAGALVDLASNDERRRTLGLHGRAKAQRDFALDVVARRKVKVFEGLMDGHAQ
jgi:glycosyltransferase involved in cell wall biosynthesis